MEITIHVCMHGNVTWTTTRGLLKLQFIRIFGYIVELFKGEALLRVVKRPTCYRGLPSLMVFYSVKFL